MTWCFFFQAHHPSLLHPHRPLTSCFPIPHIPLSFQHSSQVHQANAPLQPRDTKRGTHKHGGRTQRRRASRACSLDGGLGASRAPRPSVRPTASEPLSVGATGHAAVEALPAAEHSSSQAPQVEASQTVARPRVRLCTAASVPSSASVRLVRSPTSASSTSAAKQHVTPVPVRLWLLRRRLRGCRPGSGSGSARSARCTAAPCSRSAAAGTGAAAAAASVRRRTSNAAAAGAECPARANAPRATTSKRARVRCALPRRVRCSARLSTRLPSRPTSVGV